MERIVIACYRPKPGRETDLAALMPTYQTTLRGEGFLTDRKSIIAEAKDGTIIEVSEWKSTDAIEAAHSNASVLEMWKRYGEVCENVPIDQVEEASKLFSNFTPFKE